MKPGFLSPLVGCWLACSAAAAAPASPSGKTPASASRPPTIPDRYLFVVETSSGTGKYRPVIQQTVSNLVANGMNGRLKGGEQIRIYPFSDTVDTETFPMLVWVPVVREGLAIQAYDYLGKRRFSGRPRLDRVLEEMNTAVRASDRITIFLFTDGSQPVLGTPFDAVINGMFRQHRDAVRKAKSVFVTALTARRGQIQAWSMAAAGSFIRIPEPLEEGPNQPSPAEPAPATPDNTSSHVPSQPAESPKPAPTAVAAPEPSPQPAKPEAALPPVTRNEAEDAALPAPPKVSSTQPPREAAPPVESPPSVVVPVKAEDAMATKPDVPAATPDPGPAAAQPSPPTPLPSPPKPPSDIVVAVEDTASRSRDAAPAVAATPPLKAEPKAEPADNRASQAGKPDVPQATDTPPAPRTATSAVPSEGAGAVAPSRPKAPPPIAAVPREPAAAQAPVAATNAAAPVAQQVAVVSSPPGVLTPARLLIVAVCCLAAAAAVTILVFRKNRQGPQPSLITRSMHADDERS